MVGKEEKCVPVKVSYSKKHFIYFSELLYIGYMVIRYMVIRYMVNLADTFLIWSIFAAPRADHLSDIYCAIENQKERTSVRSFRLGLAQFIIFRELQSYFIS